MISVKQLCHKYEINLSTLLSACVRLGIKFNFVLDSTGYSEAYIKISEVPLLDNYFNCYG